MFIKLEKIEHVYFISYYIKDEIIETCKSEFYNSSPIISRSSYLLVQLLITQKQTNLIKQNDDILSNIQNFDYKEQFDINEYTWQGQDTITLLKPDIHLYNYQKQDIIWMKSIENNVDNGCNIIKYDYCEEYKALDDHYLYNDILSPCKTIYENTPRLLEYYGGNLISEVGLGKTIITLYYILQNDRELQLQSDKFVKFGDTCNYFYKRGKSRGKCCTKSKYMNFHYCQQHIKTPFMDKRRLVLQNLESFDFNKSIIYRNKDSLGLQPFIKTNASLIICKNQLCDQWVQEYYDKFQNNHRILLVVTYDQYTNLTLSDLLFSDIVIISYEFLSNKRYVQNIKKSNSLLSIYLSSYNKRL